MAGQNPWNNQNYYGNAAPYAFAYNPTNSSAAYNNSYNYRPSPAGYAPGASQGYYGSGNGPNYAPSVSEYSVQDEVYPGSGTGAGAQAGVRGNASSRWSVGSVPKEKQGQDVMTMMDNGQFSLREAKVARNIKEYRSEYRQGMWTRGSRPIIFGRFFVFFFMTAIYLIIGGLLGLALYIRPPSASVTKPDGGLQNVNFDQQDLSLTIPLQMNFSIWNPNFIKASVKKVHVDVSYLLNDDPKPIGNGTVSDVWIKSQDRTNFTLPIDVTYKFRDDPTLAILQDIISKCKSDGLKFKANVMVAANILGIGVSSPTVTINTINIGCPIPDDVLTGIQKAGSVLNLFGLDVTGG